MQQQRMQQQKEEFEQRQKQLDKEIGMREKYLKIAEDKAGQERERQLSDDFISSNMSEVLGMVEKGAGLSQVWTFLQNKNKETGGKVTLNASDFVKEYGQSEFFKTKEGPVVFRLDESGKWSLGKFVESGGKKRWTTTTLAEGVDEKVLDQFRQQPDMAMNFAAQLREKGETAGALAVEQIAKDAMKTSKESNTFELNKVKEAQGIEREAFEKRVGKKNDFGIYPGLSEDEETAKKQSQMIDAERETMVVRQQQEIMRIGTQQVETPQGQKEVARQAKKVGEPFKGSPEETIIYQGLLMQYKDDPNLTREGKIAKARAAMELVRSQVEKTGTELKKGHAKPVSAPKGKPAGVSTPGAQARPRPAYPGQYMPPTMGLPPPQPFVTMGQDEQMLNEMRRLGPRRY